MDNRINEIWGKVFDCAEEIENLIRLAADDRSKVGDSKMLENELDALTENVKLVIKQLKADGF